MKEMLASALIVALIVFGMVFPYITTDVVTVTIIDKERVTTRNDSKYLIFTENETFENVDCFRYLKFNSSDIYGKLKLNEQYTLKVYGWRIPFFSVYRNIVKITAESVKTDNK